MVQKKVPNKLGNLQTTDHVKSHKLLVNFKPSSFQESKNRGSDKKKKMMMKKYKEINFRNQIPQPGKPPPPVPPKIQSLTKTSDKKPNYMKPTTSSDARKEISQTNFKKRGNSPSRTATSLSKKWESFDVLQRPTCSSTLKDSKFPNYLTLNSRGTEVEGTSIIKVCTYTYCSLNGHHHHPPLPPLKSFLSAKRCMMKTQRSLKLGCLSSSNRSRSKKDAMEDIELLQLSFQEKHVDEEDDDFFIHIFSNGREVGDRVETEEVLESPLSEINYQESCYGKSNTISSGTDAPADYSSEENQNENAADDFLIPETTTMEALLKNDDEVNNTRDVMADVEEFSASDSELEVEGCPALYLEETITEPDETESNYFEELELEEMMGDSIDKKNDMGSYADCDQDIKNDNVQKVDIFMYDREIDNTNFMTTEVVVDAIIPPSEMDLENFNIAVEDMSPRYYIENNKDVLKEEEEANTIANQYAPSDQNLESSCIDNLNDLEKSDDDITSMMERGDSQAESDARVQVSTDIGEVSCPESDTRFQVSTDIGEESCPESDARVQVSTDIGEDSCPESDARVLRVSMEIGEAIEKGIFVLDADKNSKKGKWMYDRKESVLEQNELKDFNPRAPNFLQLEPGPEAEKVDLKHQMIDDRRNSEEWMLDYALQQAVTKLAAARKKKVTLLVEAFETVSPLPKWENKLRRHSSGGFDHLQRIQACG